MLTRLCLIATIAFVPSSIVLRADQGEARPAKPTTVTLLIEGMT